MVSAVPAVLEAIVGALVSGLRSRASLVAENLVLRQQLAVLKVGRRPRRRLSTERSGSSCRACGRVGWTFSRS
jgi:hypothetical protein